MKKIITALIALVILLVATAAVLLFTLDVNEYRPQIAEALSKKTGRTIKLSGLIKLGLTSNGLTLTIRDVGIGNPPWASRPMMAGVGTFQLDVATAPLLSRNFDVTGVTITNADILLETNKDGKGNWDMSSAAEKQTQPADKSAQKSELPVKIHVERIAITDSQLAMRGKDGKTTALSVGKMSLGREGAGMGLQFTGKANNVPVALNVKTGIRDLMAVNGTWPMNAALTYANYSLSGQGRVDADKKILDLSSYELKSRNTTLQGQMSVSWGGTRPSLRGSVLSDRLVLEDLKPEPSTSSEKTVTATPSGPNRLFSNTPLGLDALKAVDADLDVKFNEVPMGDGGLRQVTAKLDLKNGLLALAPIKAQIGKNSISGQIKVDGASSPGQASLSFSAPHVELADITALAQLPAFLTGKGSAEIDIAGKGDSMHGMASTAVGRINIIAEGGNVAPGAAQKIATGLMNLFAPGSGAHGLNCLAARFIIKDGVVRDNGILADTSATTVAGNGGFDLGAETVNLILRAQPKVRDLGGLIPPMRITGSLSDPQFVLDPSGTVQNVVGLLTTGSVNNHVPALISPPGENACLYTLEHPAAEPSAKSPLLPSPARDAQEQIKNLGGTLKRLMGQ